MTIPELAKEYRESAEAVAARLLELTATPYAVQKGSEYTKMRRISILRSMHRDTIWVAKLLENYYKGGTT